LHRWLATASILAVILVGLEAGWRTWRRTPPATPAGRFEALFLIVLGASIAGGLGLLAGGGRPGEVLHFVYAIVALGALPVANSLAKRTGSRAQGLTTLVAAVVTLAVIARLFGTG